MKRPRVPEFTDMEWAIVRETAAERFGHPVEVNRIEGEVRLDPADRETVVRPGLHWKERNANFVIFKVADGRFRAQFYYRVHQQFGTGRDEYDDLGDCVVTLLQVQADHERKEATNPPVDPGPVAKPGTEYDSDNLEYYWD